MNRPDSGGGSGVVVLNLTDLDHPEDLRLLELAGRLLAPHGLLPVLAPGPEGWLDALDRIRPDAAYLGAPIEDLATHHELEERARAGARLLVAHPLRPSPHFDSLHGCPTQGVDAALEYLLEREDRIGCLASEPQLDTHGRGRVSRYSPYARAVDDGRIAEPAVAVHDGTRRGMRRGAARLIDAGVGSILCTSRCSGEAADEEAAERGLRVPLDLRVVAGGRAVPECSRRSFEMAVSGATPALAARLLVDLATGARRPGCDHGLAWRVRA
ncbi:MULTISPECIES: hypothetical protein [unclassified Pseudactinotalea]|uniref:hypothetical protein n=1 Tax=unclassified Pseudactinotalea TaxID=2649176 RepID=UPI00128B6695|nr:MULTISPECIES: hypothetical protein [unclassified Pseudactinotalea]MPV51111.1 hypothetical protein [Pseudactinotalea sp. HY160]QGH70305.1 hypothetical protein GCE65_12975 [Pseudactinotalea sp. HY158]